MGGSANRESPIKSGILKYFYQCTKNEVFQLWISTVNVTKSAFSCGRNPSRKLHFLCIVCSEQ